MRQVGKTKRVYLSRHGVTLANRIPISSLLRTEQIDFKVILESLGYNPNPKTFGSITELSPLGHTQARRLGRYLRQKGYASAKIKSSSRLRAVDTAKTIYHTIFSEGVQEFEGAYGVELHEGFNEISAGGIESRTEELAALFLDYVKDGELLVAHSNVNQAILNGLGYPVDRLLQMGAYPFANCALATLEIVGERISTIEYLPVSKMNY